MVNIFDVLKPALLPRHFFGFLSIKFGKNRFTKTHLERSNTHFIIWSIIQIFLTILITELYWSSIQYYSNLNSILEWMTYILYYILDYVLFIVSVLASKLNNDKIISVLNKLTLIENHLKSIGVKLDYTLKYKIIFIVIFHVTINFIHILTLTYADYQSAKDVYASLYRSSITIYIDYAQITQVLLFASIVLVIRDMLKKVMEVLELKCRAHCNRVNNPAKEFVIQVAVLYQDIFENFREYLQAVYYQILVEFGMVFSITIFHTFNLLMWIFHHRHEEKYTTTVWFSVCVVIDAVLTIGLYIIVSEAYHNEVSDNLSHF